MQSAVILSSALLLAFLTAPIFSLPIAERSTNELQLIPKLPDQLSDSGLAKRDISPSKCSSVCCHDDDYITIGLEIFVVIKFL